MAVDDARRRLLHLAEAHRGEGDGGYALARDLLAALREGGEADRRDARAQLLAWVDGQDARMWGVALEALVQDGAAETGAALEALLRAGGRDAEWREQVILSLLRMRYAPALDLYVEAVEVGVREGRPFVLRLLQHLYALNAERALSLSARFFAGHLPAEEEELAGFVQGQLSALAELDESLVPLLVRRTAAADPAAGSALVRRMSGFLEMPWLRDRLGAPRAARIKESLAAALA
jgi:hypothetical protein